MHNFYLNALKLVVGTDFTQPWVHFMVQSSRLMINFLSVHMFWFVEEWQVTQLMMQMVIAYTLLHSKVLVLGLAARDGSSLAVSISLAAG